MYSHSADHRYRYFNTPWASAEPRVGAGNLRIWNTVPPEHLELEFESPTVYVAEQLYGPFFSSVEGDWEPFSPDLLLLLITFLKPIG